MRDCRAVSGVLIAIVMCAAGAQQAASLPRDIPDIVYRPIARAAHVQGDVEVAFLVRRDGSTEEIKALSGPQMLRGAAESAVRSWHYPPSATERFKGDVFFEFALVDPGDDQDSDGPPHTSVTLDKPNHVRVTADGRGNIRLEGCPKTAEEREVPQVSVAGDFVETGWPMLRVEASGLVLWNPPGPFDSPDWQLATKAEIDPANARKLLEDFRSKAFWRLCRSYDNGATDTATDFLRVSLGGVVKEVSDHGDVAPGLFEDLLQEVHAVTDSHRWRVGDPKHERMGDISHDAWLPKPGRTVLMAEAYHGEMEKVRAAVEAGADVNAKDDSGWTALMYAAARYATGDVVRYLLSQHADVNAHGLAGETALQFASMRGDANELLLKAGADVNAHGEGGVTSLMLLAQESAPQEMEKLLAAGAEPNAEDEAGRTAMDYLLAESCGREIMPRDTHPWMTLGYGSCKVPDGDDDLARCEMLLQNRNVKAKKVWVALIDPGGF
jgi:hypothetical protein